MNNNITQSKKYWIIAKRYYEKANKVINYQNNNNQYTKTIILLKVQILWGEARVYLALDKRRDLVKRNLLQAWQLSNTTHSIWAQEENAQLLGRYYESIGNFEEAKKWYNITLNKAKKSKNVDRLIESYLYLAKLCLKNKHYIELNLYIKKAQKILSPLVIQALPKNHQFYQFREDIESLKLVTIDP